MKDLHPNPEANAWAQGKFVYALCATLTATTGQGCVSLIGLAILPDTPTDLYFSWFIVFCIVWLPFIVLLDNPAESRSRVEACTAARYSWSILFRG